MQESQSDLDSLKHQFASWRSRRASEKGRTPEKLWRETVRLCDIYPVGTVRKELGLDLNRLKAKISQFKKEQKRPKPTFVSVEFPVPQASDPVCEWVRPDGAKLRIRIQPGSIDQLVRSFLGGRP